MLLLLATLAFIGLLLAAGMVAADRLALGVACLFGTFEGIGRGGMPVVRAQAALFEPVNQVAEILAQASGQIRIGGTDPVAPVFFQAMTGHEWVVTLRFTVARNTFRNWDYPIRRQIFSGFRCARDA